MIGIGSKGLLTRLAELFNPDVEYSDNESNRIYPPMPPIRAAAPQYYELTAHGDNTVSAFALKTGCDKAEALQRILASVQFMIENNFISPEGEILITRKHDGHVVRLQLNPNKQE